MSHETVDDLWLFARWIGGCRVPPDRNLRWRRDTERCVGELEPNAKKDVRGVVALRSILFQDSSSCSATAFKWGDTEKPWKNGRSMATSGSLE